MATEVHNGPDTGLVPLVKGIVNDIGDLIKQEFRFAQTEIKTDLRKTREAVLSLAIGAGAAFVGAFLLCLMLPLLLHWLTLPSDTAPAGLPLWACFGIVGGLILTTGLVMVGAGKKKLDSFNPLPDQTVQNVKENVEWITNSK